MGDRMKFRTPIAAPPTRLLRPARQAYPAASALLFFVAFSCAARAAETSPPPRLEEVEKELQAWRDETKKQEDPGVKPPVPPPSEPRLPSPQPPRPEPPKPDQPKPEPPKEAPRPEPMSPQEIAQAYRKVQPIVNELTVKACAAVEQRSRKLTNAFERGIYMFMTQRYAEAYQYFQERVKRDNSSSNRSRDGNNPNVSGQADIWLAKLATMVNPADERSFSYWLECANKIRVDKAEVEYYTQKWRPYWLQFAKEYPDALSRSRSDPEELWKLIERFYDLEEYENNHPRPYAIWRMQRLAEMHYCFPDHPRVADGTCDDRFTETLSFLYLDREASEIAKELIEKRPNVRIVKSGEMLWRLCNYLQGAGIFEEAIERLREFQKAYPKHWANQPRRHLNIVLPTMAQERLDQCVKRTGQR
jgi:hypothetical protein